MLQFGPRMTWDLKFLLCLFGGAAVMTGWSKYGDIWWVPWLRDGLTLGTYILTFLLTGAVRPAAPPTTPTK
jgi:hypothetical protein